MRGHVRALKAATRHTRALALVAALQNVTCFFLQVIIQGFSKEEPVSFLAGPEEPIWSTAIGSGYREN